LQKRFAQRQQIEHGSHLNRVRVCVHQGMPAANRVSCTVEPFYLEGDIEMPLVNVVITLLVVGILLWLINRFIPMQGTIKGILNAVVVIVVVVWILNVFGLMHYITTFRVGH
jgi:hypothetical protein